jgi:hypothetical protein
MMTRSAFGLAVLAGLMLLGPVPGIAADGNTLTLVGNVTGVTRTIQTGQPTRDTLAIAVLAGMPSGVTVPLHVSVACTAAMGCYDSWWLSSGCTYAFASASIDFSGGTLKTYTCANPHTYGACVEVVGHLWTDSQGIFTVVPDSILALPSSNCSWKP